MIASVCVHVCAGNKTFKTCCCEKSCSRPEGTSLDTKWEVFWGGGAGRRGKRDAGTFSISARTSMWCCLAVILSIKCRHSVPAHTCPFQPSAGAVLRLYDLRGEDMGVSSLQHSH